MKLKILSLSALCLGLSLNANAQTMQLLPDASPLTVNITNLSNSNGVVRIALFNSATAFQNASDAADQAIAKAALPITNNTTTWTVKVPYGTYAIKAFHDENNSGKLTRNFFGVPTEDYGFSNMNSSSSGKPTFDQAAFTFSPSNSSITIQMKQP